MMLEGSSPSSRAFFFDRLAGIVSHEAFEPGMRLGEVRGHEEGDTTPPAGVLNLKARERVGCRAPPCRVTLARPRLRRETSAMLEFSDASYRFFPAEPSPFLIGLGRFANRHFILPGKNHRIRELRLEGDTELVREARARGERLIFVINHRVTAIPRW